MDSGKAIQAPAPPPHWVHAACGKAYPPCPRDGVMAARHPPAGRDQAEQDVANIEAIPIRGLLDWTGRKFPLL